MQNLFSSYYFYDWSIDAGHDLHHTGLSSMFFDITFNIEDFTAVERRKGIIEAQFCCLVLCEGSRKGSVVSD